MSHNPGGPLPEGDREACRPWRAAVGLDQRCPGALPVLQSPCLQLNCFFSSAILTIVHASTIRPDEKRKKLIPSIPIRAPLPGIPPATTVFVPSTFQCTATRSLSATVRSNVTLRSGMAARQDLVAALSCSRV